MSKNLLYLKISNQHKNTIQNKHFRYIKKLPVRRKTRLQDGVILVKSKLKDSNTV